MTAFSSVEGPFEKRDFPFVFGIIFELILGFLIRGAGASSQSIGPAGLVFFVSEEFVFHTRLEDAIAGVSLSFEFAFGRLPRLFFGLLESDFLFDFDSNRGLGKLLTSGASFSLVTTKLPSIFLSLPSALMKPFAVLSCISM